LSISIKWSPIIERPTEQSASASRAIVECPYNYVSCECTAQYIVIESSQRRCRYALSYYATATQIFSTVERRWTLRARTRLLPTKYKQLYRAEPTTIHSSDIHDVFEKVSIKLNTPQTIMLLEALSFISTVLGTNSLNSRLLKLMRR